MFVNMSPNFKKGIILKQEMLENIRDYPRNYVDMYFSTFSNGILFGCDLDIKDDYIIIRKGCIKHRDKIYMLEKDYSLPYSYTNEEVVIKVKFLEEKIEKDFIVYPTEILLDKNIIINEEEFELGRFKLKDGSRLRNDYQNFLDLSTEYNTLNVINVKYASQEKDTISPTIIKCFTKEILKKNSTNIYDINFIMHSINEKLLTRDLINYYISLRLNIAIKKRSNLEIYLELNKILQESKNSSSVSNRTRNNRVSKIIVD